MNKDYQPIPMRTLTMRGVFGITWAVTKRHFFAGVMYTLIWVLIAAAVLALCAAPAVIGIVANNAGQEGGVAALVALSVILMFVGFGSMARAGANYERRALYGNVHAHIRPKLHPFSAFQAHRLHA